MRIVRSPSSNLTPYFWIKRSSFEIKQRSFRIKRYTSIIKRDTFRLNSTSRPHFKIKVDTFRLKSIFNATLLIEKHSFRIERYTIETKRDTFKLKSTLLELSATQSKLNATLLNWKALF